MGLEISVSSFRCWVHGVLGSELWKGFGNLGFICVALGPPGAGIRDLESV